MKLKIDIKKYRKPIKVVAIIIGILLLALFIRRNTITNEFKKMNVNIELLEGGDGIVTMDLHYRDKKQTKEQSVQLRSGSRYETIDINKIKVEKDGETYAVIEDGDKEKAAATGIFLYDKDEMKLRWSVDEPGKKTYKISYGVEELVNSLSDYDVFYYELIYPSSEYPNTVEVKVRTKKMKGFNIDNVRMWNSRI